MGERLIKKASITPDRARRMRFMAVDVPRQLHRYTLDEYHQLIESGGFDEDSRVELINGFLADMSPKTPDHENTIRWLTRFVVSGTDGDRFNVGIGAPLTIGGSEPEPDVTVVERSTPAPYHPATAALVIEVSFSSLHRDLREKPPIYAEAGVPVYWVVDLHGSRVVVHTDPRDAEYTSIEIVGPDGELRADHVGLPPLSVGELLAAATR